MLDIPIWSEKYSNDKYAEYAIRGPTLDLYCASYKNTNPDNYLEYSYNKTGYNVKLSANNIPIVTINDRDNLYYITDTNKAYTMWIASPHALDKSVMSVLYYGEISGSTYRSYLGFRPVVCLKSDMQLKKISDTEYMIIDN